MNITYQRASREDIARICAMSDDLISRYEDFSKVNKEKALGLTHLQISENIDRFSVILVDGEKAGYLLMNWKNGIYEMHDLYVEPAYQNRGIGTRIIQQCIKDSDGNLMVYVFTGDLGTFSLFENLGFKAEKVLGRTRYVMRYQKQEVEDNEEME